MAYFAPPSPKPSYAYYSSSPYPTTTGLPQPPPGTVYAAVPSPGSSPYYAPAALPAVPTPYYVPVSPGMSPGRYHAPLPETIPPIHPQLSTDSKKREMKWHVGYPSHSDHHPLPHDLTANAATYPAVKSLKIISASFPWTIHVEAKRHSHVTPEDVLIAIYEGLQKPMTNPEYRLVPPKERAKILKYFEERVGPYSEERNKGVKRIDFLQKNVMFGGLEEDDELVRTEIGEGIKGSKYWVLRLNPVR